MELLETSTNKIKEVEADRAALLESSTRITNKLREEVREVRSQLERERADREEVEVQLADLRQKSALASELLELKDLKTHDLLDVVNQVTKNRKKCNMNFDDLKLSVKLLSEKLKKSCDDIPETLGIIPG